MKIKEFILKIKRKAFATYEYNEKLNSIETIVFSLNKNHEKLIQRQEEIRQRIDSLNIICKEVIASQSELLNVANREFSSVINSIQVVSDKVEPLQNLSEMKSSLTSSRMVLNSISKNTKELTIKNQRFYF